MKILKALFSIFLCVSFSNKVFSVESFCPTGNSPDSDVLFCESFESQGTSSTQIDSSSYFEFDDDNGDMQRTDSEFFEGSHSLRVLWQAGEVEAGSFQINFGRSPLQSNISSNIDFREIYWRMYLKLPANFQGFPDKLSRLTSMANSNWAQAMSAHVWGNENDLQFLMIDPVSGIENNALKTTKWNDFSNFNWLGGATATTLLPKGRWVCVEAHVKLNTIGTTNGVFELFMDGQLEASKSNINWVGDWNQYSLNSILFSNYWNGSSPVEQARYIDAIVVSQSRIGCIQSTQLTPKAPMNLTVGP